MYKIIKEKDWKKSVWSGGETNEIFIYPSDANYSNRCFKARISIATTISKEKSCFTSLPGVDRFIAKLDGEMNLSHYEHYDVEMEKYQIDRFKGDWETWSSGKFKDFNLMLKDVRGDLYFREIKGICKLHLEKGSNYVFLYVIEGKITVNGTDVKENELYLVKDCYILDVEAREAKIFYGFIKEWD